MKRVLPIFTILFLAASIPATAGLLSDWCNDRKCQEWGAKPGTELYVRCRMALELSDSERRRDALKGLLDLQKAFQPQQQQPVIQQSPSIRCTSYWSNGTLISNCN